MNWTASLGLSRKQSRQARPARQRPWRKRRRSALIWLPPRLRQRSSRNQRQSRGVHWSRLPRWKAPDEFESRAPRGVRVRARRGEPRPDAKLSNLRRSRHRNEGADALDDALFARTDRKIVALAQNPRPTGCKSLMRILFVLVRDLRVAGITVVNQHSVAQRQ